jgi:hypothetical protein
MRYVLTTLGCFGVLIGIPAVRGEGLQIEGLAFLVAGAIGLAVGGATCDIVAAIERGRLPQKKEQ